jgi:hypothetical protein
MIDNQMARRNLESAAKISLALLKKDLLRDEAGERMLAGKKLDPPPDLAEGGKGDVRDIIAKDAGVSHGTVDKFLFIQKHASEEEMKRLCSGERDAEGNNTTSGS